MTRRPDPLKRDPRRRALITGAANGIGRALALHMHERGWDVAGIDRDEETARALPFAYERCDLADRSDVAACLETLAGREPFDCVVHNAGINCTGRFEETDLAAQQEVIAVNLRAPLLLTAGLLRGNHIRQGGTLVFVSSLSHQVGYPGAAVYAATKDGLTSYARSLHVALGPRRIDVLTVFPGPVRTEHARRHSPPGSDASRRMPAEDVAAKIATAIRRRKRVLVPGLGASVFAGLGRLLPRVTERAMRKAIYERLP